MIKQSFILILFIFLNINALCKLITFLLYEKITSAIFLLPRTRIKIYVSKDKSIIMLTDSN